MDSQETITILMNKIDSVKLEIKNEINSCFNTIDARFDLINARIKNLEGRPKYNHGPINSKQLLDNVEYSEEFQNIVDLIGGSILVAPIELAPTPMISPSIDHVDTIKLQPVKTYQSFVMNNNSYISSIDIFGRLYELTTGYKVVIRATSLYLQSDWMNLFQIILTSAGTYELVLPKINHVFDVEDLTFYLEVLPSTVVVDNMTPLSAPSMESFTRLALQYTANIAPSVPISILCVLSIYFTISYLQTLLLSLWPVIPPWRHKRRAHQSFLYHLPHYGQTGDIICLEPTTLAIMCTSLLG